MTTYYVRKTGSNSNAGTSAGSAWLTIGKALTTVASGDSVYVGAGTYRETITVTITPVAETLIIGDTDGAQTGDAGEIIITAYTTNDTTAPAAASTIDLNGKDYLTFRKITIIGGNTDPGCIGAYTAHSTNIKFEDCTLMAGASQPNIGFLNTANQASNWTLDRCIIFQTYYYSILVLLARSASADYDSNFVLKNCILVGSGDNSIVVSGSGAGSFFGGGVDILNCSSYTGELIRVSSANISTTIPCTVYNSTCANGGGGLYATTLGQVIENYNLLYSDIPRVNVAVGANSISNGSYAPLVHIGQELKYGANIRPFGMPKSSSPWLGFGNQTGSPDVDLLNRIRPAGGSSTTKGVGALERHETAAKETSTVRTGTTSIVLTGPADHDFLVPVNAAATTVTVYGYYDSSHAATNKPQMKILNGGECGVSDATATMTAAASTWEQLSLSFTPTSQGYITVRLISRSAANTGKAFFDDFNVV